MNQNVECQVETPEYKKEIGFLVNDFLKAQEIQGANDIKEIIRSKITETCNIQEIQDLRDDFSEKGQNLTGKEKFKMYELSAMLSNYLKEIRANPQLQTQRVPQPLGGDVYGELENPTQNFERNEIPQNTFQLDAGYASGKKEYFFNPERSNIVHKGGNNYEVTYSFSRESGKYLTKSNQETINVQIGESGHHTIVSENSRRSVQFFSPIQNNGQTDTIELTFHDREKNVTLILSRPNPQQQIYIRH